MWMPSRGTLDTTFDTDGKATTPVAASNEYAAATAVQPDGKVLSAGYVYSGGNWMFGVVRYNVNGSLDTTFDTDGKVLTDVGPGADYARAMALQPDGKIVVAGATTGGEFAAARLLANGTLDPGFGTGGRFHVLVGNGATGGGWSIGRQRDGMLVVGGTAVVGAQREFGAVRLTMGGALDTTFGTLGKLTVPFGASNADGQPIVVGSDDRVTMAGFPSFPFSAASSGMYLATGSSTDNLPSC